MVSNTNSVEVAAAAAAAVVAEEMGSFSTEVEAEAAVAAAVVTAEETGSFSSEDKEHVIAVAQSAETVAKAAVVDVKAAEAVATRDGGDCPTSMTWTQFVVAYKRVPQEEIEYILCRQRKPLEATALYMDMIAKGSTTKEELEREAADHKCTEDMFSERQDRVRREYADKGFVAVDDDEIAERVEVDEYLKETWYTMISQLNLDESHFGYDD